MPVLGVGVWCGLLSTCRVQMAPHSPDLGSGHHPSLPSATQRSDEGHETAAQRAQHVRTQMAQRDALDKAEQRARRKEERESKRVSQGGPGTGRASGLLASEVSFCLSWF